MFNFFCFSCLLISCTAHATLNWTSFQQVPAKQPVSSMQLAVNQNSKALFAWFQPQDHTICTASYDCILKKWEPTLKIPTTGASIAILATYYTETQKGGMVWFDEQNNTLYLSHLNQDNWSLPTLLQIPFPAEDIQSLFDSSGNLCLVWTAWNGLEKMIQGVFYSENLQSWTSITDLSTIGFQCSAPKITLNSQGKGALVWQSVISTGLGSATQSFVQMATFDLYLFQWSQYINFGYDWVNTFLTQPDIMMDEHQNIAIAWEAVLPNQEEKRVQYVRFLAKQDEWSYIHEMERGTYRPRFSSRSQNTQFLWISSDGLNVAQFDLENHSMCHLQNLAASFSPTSDFKVACDALGKRNLMWLQAGTLETLHYNKKWMPLHCFHQNLPIQAFDFSYDALGNIVLVILQEGQLLYAIGNYLLPPQVFEGKKIEVRYPSRKAIHGKLSWSHAESPNIAGYILRRDNAVLAILPAHTSQHTDYRCPNKHTKYELSVLNVDNIESLPIKRTL